MSNAVNILKRMLGLKIRKSVRHKAKNGTFVVMENSVARNPIANISMTGLSFNYEDAGYAVGKNAGSMRIVAGSKLIVSNIPFKKIADESVGEVLYPYRKIKRVSVQFGKLTGMQKVKLRQFIRQYTSGKA